MQTTLESRKIRIKSYIDNLKDERLLVLLEQWLFGEMGDNISDEEMALLDERLAENSADPDATIPWEEFVKQLKGGH